MDQWSVVMGKRGPIIAAFAIALLHGCASLDGSMAAEAAPSQTSGKRTDSIDGRLLIRSASLSVEVGDVPKSAARATEIVSNLGGFVEKSTASEEGRVDLVVRVPEAQLDDALRRFEELGDVTRRSVMATDVTDEVVDLDARMKNLVTTRDSFRQLLEKSASVQDVVAVERELSRVQGEIDSMEARLKSLRSKIALSEVHLELKKARILGPIGVVGKGVWWLVSKLFVISG